MLTKMLRNKHWSGESNMFRSSEIVGLHASVFSGKNRKIWRHLSQPRIVYKKYTTFTIQLLSHASEQSRLAAQRTFPWILKNGGPTSRNGGAEKCSPQLLLLPCLLLLSYLPLIQFYLELVWEVQTLAINSYSNLYRIYLSCVSLALLRHQRKNAHLQFARSGR